MRTSTYFGIASALLRPSAMEAPKQDGGDVIHQFKARPLNKKVRCYNYD